MVADPYCYGRLPSREEINAAVHKAIAEVKLRSRQYAKRQRTWFRHRNTYWVLWDKSPDFSAGLQNATEYLTACGLR